MKLIYIDIFLEESEVQDFHYSADTSKKLMQVHYEQIAARHKVTKNELLNSMQYYATHPQIYSETLQTVIDSLSAIEARTH